MTPVRLLLGLLCAVLSGCTSVFLYPDRVQHLADRALGTPAEDVWIEARDGNRLHALHLPAQGALKATLLHLHGNAENLSSHVHLVSWLPARGYAVLALDSRGYGRSQGAASVAAMHEDAEAALAWLVARGQSRTGPLIVLGQSIGGSVAIRMVAQSPLREHVTAVVADSAFSGYRRIAREKLAQPWLTWPLQWPLSLLVSDRFAAVDVVAGISPIPLLLIHGERDIIVDASHSQRLYAAASEPKTLWRIAQGGHIDALRSDSVQARLVEYLDRIVQANND
ncbi:alpha/beta hydrolase [Algiphilus sp. W345]|uniref:Alpha/beta hydrolase n=1 Tax=Banduia mediterranea TaxID=3075609 RepID=A0ABU2WFM5_9GAMM|nr:alpha/beta hydrolase [Algiphilus sp. W345]MDT0496667.1 alpha/beta hydrolase [Algiphilus sp. W345]